MCSARNDERERSIVVLTPTGVWEDVCPLEDRVLLSDHLRILTDESAIDPDIIIGRGYHSLSLSQVTELVGLEVLASQALSAVSWLSIPLFRPDGSKHGELVRLFGGKSRMKYLWPTGLRLAFDIHPDCLPYVRDERYDVIITEGVKKGDSLLSAARREGKNLIVLSTNGCTGWRVKLDGHSVATTDYQDIGWEDRRVFVISDSDYRSNDEVAKGWDGCVRYTSGLTGDHRTFLVIVPPHGEEKVGADDYLAAGQSLDSLLGHAQTLRNAADETDTDPIPLKLKTGGQLMREAGIKIPYLIAPLLPEGSIMLVAGHTGTFKTWAMLNLALDGAFGFPWMDHPAMKPDLGPFTTLYVNKEMSGIILGQRLRLLAAAKRYTDIPGWEKTIDERIIFADEAALDLATEKQRDRLEDAIQSTGAKFTVLDSLSMSWHGNENDASEVGSFYSQIRGIIERTRTSWGLIHHLLKPTSGHLKKGDPVTASIRGSGQLAQQADVALMLAHYQADSETRIGAEKLITMTHAKARTDVELPSWITRFDTNDGFFASFSHLCSLADAKARAYSKSPDNDSTLSEWVLEEAKHMPAMASISTGMRFRQLVSLLQQAWTVDDKAPAESTLRRQIQQMVQAGQLVLVEQNRRSGDLYRLPDPDLPEFDFPGGEPDERVEDPGGE
jgi:hypothetical protein